MSARQERKVLTVLFCDLVGFTSRAESLDPEDVDAFLRGYHERVRQELERYGGTVEKFVGDAVMALFGAPTAHEDDPERAVRAALAIRDGADAELRIGITTGEALVTLGARPERGEGMASGDVINTASRLQAAAPPNGILVDRATYRAIRHVVECDEHEPIEPKGKTEPVSVWMLRSARTRLGVDVIQTARTRLVGRDLELDLLVGALAEARERRAFRLVTLVGAPGLGKSRVVWELLRVVEAERDPTTWHQGRSLAYGGGGAFWALGEIVKGHAGILDSDAEQPAGEKLRRAVRRALARTGEADWAESLLRPLVGLAHEDVWRGRRGEAFAAWRRFLEAVAERSPLVLVLEDLHWADDGVLDFVEGFAERAPDVPLLVVGTARPEFLERRPGWGRSPNALTLALSPLSDEDSERLLLALLDEARLPAEVHDLLLAQAGGNPLYAEQYVAMLVERGFLVRERSGTRVDRTRELPPPEPLQAVIAARLDALPPEEKTVLQDAAVVGKVFWSGVVGALDGADAAALEDRLDVLVKSDYLRRERDSSVAGETEYAFRHILVRDVAYRTITRGGRAEKHRRVAEWIEALAPDRSDDYAELLAHHYGSALELARATRQETDDLAERTRRAQRAAGDRASALSAFEAAARYYEAALALSPPDDPERAGLLFGRGRALYHLHDDGTALLEAHDALAAAGDDERAALAEFYLGELGWRQGEGDAALERMERAVTVLAGQPASWTLGYMLATWSFFLGLRNRDSEAIEAGRAAAAIGEELGFDDVRAHALTCLGTARTATGDVEGGIADLERALEIAVPANLPEMVIAYGNLGSVMWSIGEVERAFELQAACRETAEHFEHWAVRWTAAERANELYFDADWDAALAVIEEWLAADDAIEYVEVGLRILRADIRRARAGAAAAREDAERALESARRIGDLQVLLPALALRAHLAIEDDDPELAATLADELLHVYEGRRGLAGEWVVPLAWSLAALDRGEDFAVVTDAPGFRTRWLDAAAAIATADFERASETFAEMGVVPWEAYARLRAGSDDQVRRALAFYRSVGATRYIGDGEALLAASA